MDKYISVIKKYVNDESKRMQHYIVILGTVLALMLLVLFTGGRKEMLIKKTVNFAEAKSSEFIDNHDYKELPWDVLLTIEDKNLLVKEDIPKLPELEIKEQNVLEVIDFFNVISQQTSELLKDKDLYADSLDDKNVLNKPLEVIYKNSEVYGVYKDTLGDIYSRSYTFVDDMYPVSLKQEISGVDKYQWIVNFELRTLQDSKDYLIYPVTLTFDEGYKFINGDSGSPFESPSGTRPLDNTSLVTDDSHKYFLSEYNEFSKLFNKDVYSGKTDKIHLKTMATEDVSLELLEDMYEASRGDLSNASITSWEMDDKKAEAVSNYRLDIPVDSKGKLLSINIEYSRPYNKITSMSKVE